jgi:hypothetical protein
LKRKSVIELDPTIGTAYTQVRAYEKLLSAALLTLAFGLCTVSTLFSQEHEVSKAELLVGHSYLGSDTNFNGRKAMLVGDVNHSLGVVADLDGHYPKSFAVIALFVTLKSSAHGSPRNLRRSGRAGSRS